jgi:mono/diheme cytochrome c family protein
MNYPVWEVAFGGGLLVAIVSIVHVVVSHFAVGGGLFLVLTEAKAARRGDAALLDWVKRHSTFFVLLTVVFGAVSGVGIWFTIGLVNPSGTSALIHSFVWGWAIEWVFFFIEITAAILYLYGWERLDRKTHLWIGWIYFVAAYLSLVVINGIITFMLTPGAWLETRGFWDGILNPTYWPSLVFRTAISVALAGIYALLTASVQKDRELKARVVRWAGAWIIPGLVAAPLAAIWYVGAVPEQAWAGATGKMPTATLYANLILYFSAAVLVFGLATLIWPRRVNLGWSLLVFLAAFGAFGSFEFIRESIRKPYVIRDYLYANSIYPRPVPGDAGLNVETLNRDGVLARARFVRHREVTDLNRLEAGRDLFVLQCMACHTERGHRGMVRPLQKKQWDCDALVTRLGTLDKMHNRVMPPFVGTRAEREALAAYLASIAPVTEKKPAPEPGAPAPTLDGAAIWAQHCADCHDREDIEDPAIVGFLDKDAKTIAGMIGRLKELNDQMAPFAGTDAEREALARWIAAEIEKLKKENE